MAIPVLKELSHLPVVVDPSHAAAALGFTFPELAVIARNGFESAFASRHERRTMLDTFDRELPSLISQA